MGIFNLVFRILGATPRVWFAPSGSDGLRAAAGTAGRAHACVTPRRLPRGGGGGAGRGPPRPSRAPLAVPAPPPHKMAAGPRASGAAGRGKMAAAG